MSFPALEFQKHVFGLLIADTDLMNAVTGVYDNVPQNAVFPYITIADISYDDRGNESTEGSTATLQISVWAERDASKLQTLEIQTLVDAVLHRSDESPTACSFPGWKVLTFHRTFHTIELDPDNVTYQGVQRFEVLLAENDI